MSQLLPRRLDNTYRGHKLALWLFGLLLFVRGVMGVNTIFNGHSVLISADGIPLDAYPPAASRAIVSLFALLGLSHLTIFLLGILILVRYRSMVPLMFALLLLDHLGKRLILQFLPIARTDTKPAFYINLALLALMLGGLVLSLWKRGNHTEVSSEVNR